MTSEVLVQTLTNFQTNYPRIFFTKEGDGRFTHDSREVTVFADDDKVFVNYSKRIVSIFRDLPSLHGIRERLVSKPIIFLTKILARQFIDGDIIIDEGDEFVVLVQGSHPIIRAQILHSLNACEDLLKRGKQFTLKFSIEKAIKTWYSTIYRPQYFARNFLQHCCMGACFGLTVFNSVNTDLTESVINNELAWIVFLPGMAVMAPIYWIYRGVTCKRTKAELDVSNITLVTYEGFEVFLHESGSNSGARRRINAVSLDIPASITTEEDLPPNYDVCHLNSYAPPTYTES